MLRMPSVMPILFASERSSLKTMMPTKTTQIRFCTVKTEIAFDKYPSFNEIAKKNGSNEIYFQSNDRQMRTVFQGLFF